MKLPKLEKDDNIEDIDPFTIFALFNKGNSNNSKIKILNSIAKIFDIQNPVPSAFDGIPTVYNLKAAFTVLEMNAENMILTIYGKSLTMLFTILRPYQTHIKIT